MNTVDSLNKFGTAICGENFVSTPGKTDAETIEQIAKCIKESGSISGNRLVIELTGSEPVVGRTSPGLTPKALCEACFRIRPGEYWFPVSVALGDYYIEIGLIVADSGAYVILDYNPVNGDIIVPGEPEPEVATVTYDLKNVTSSNNATQVAFGSSYTTTLTVDPGYELATIYANMGGESVPMSDLTLDIPSVTGDIVITARADSSPGPIG